MTTSQNGWSASANKADIHVKNYDVPGTTRHLSCAQGCAPILISFAAQFHAQIEKIDTGTYDDWGWGVGDNRGIEAMKSNHASGTAIDLNATIHPWQKVGSFSILKAGKLRKLVKQYGLRWGGDYHTTKDEMHFEIIETPQQVNARIAEMQLPMPKESK